MKKTREKRHYSIRRVSIDFSKQLDDLALGLLYQGVYPIAKVTKGFDLEKHTE